jgi:hypothetical protein
MQLRHRRSLCSLLLAGAAILAAAPAIRLRAYVTRLLVLEIGRASIDLYSGRLALSDEDLLPGQRARLGGRGANQFRNAARW